MKYFFYLSIIISTLHAQNEYINQVLLLNEGALDFNTNEVIEPVKIGKYNPSSNTYETIIQIDNVDFATDIVINEDYFLVAADNKIMKYHLDTYLLMDSINIPGVRKMCVFNNNLFVTKGDYDPFSFGPVEFESYLDVISLNDFMHDFRSP